MAFPRKHIYKPGSPGEKRKQAGVTLTALKREIASAPSPAKARRDARRAGLLGG